MATQQQTIDFLVEQMAGAGQVAARKMFGEYGIFCDGKMVAIVGGDELYVKPTKGGRAHVGDVPEKSPYPGAKPCFLIAGEKWDDADWLAELIRLTAAELPMPAPKKPKVKKTP
jgi:TfoX/Sxy family transcriptional regulator of competence genes